MPRLPQRSDPPCVCEAPVQDFTLTLIPALEAPALLVPGEILSVSWLGVLRGFSHFSRFSFGLGFLKVRIRYHCYGRAWRKPLIPSSSPAPSAPQSIPEDRFP